VAQKGQNKKETSGKKKRSDQSRKKKSAVANDEQRRHLEKYNNDETPKSVNPLFDTPRGGGKGNDKNAVAEHAAAGEGRKRSIEPTTGAAAQGDQVGGRNRGCETKTKKKQEEKKSGKTFDPATDLEKGSEERTRD